MSILPMTAAHKICEMSGWTATHLSVQKILYFSNMFYVGENKGQPLFEEHFEAWMYGPVLPSLYDKLKMFGADPIQNIFNKPLMIAEEMNCFLESIGGALLKRTAADLVTLTHQKNGAWAKNYVSYSNMKIPHTDIWNEYREFDEKYRRAA